MDMNDPESVVSPGGVGFDINCGVRLIRTNLTEKDLTTSKKEELAQELFDHIPVSSGNLEPILYWKQWQRIQIISVLFLSKLLVKKNKIKVGVGTKGHIPATEKDLNEILSFGIDWAIKKGFAWPEDKEHCEEHGRMNQADASKVSHRAKKRGLPQL